MLGANIAERIRERIRQSEEFTTTWSLSAEQRRSAAEESGKSMAELVFSFTTNSQPCATQNRLCMISNANANTNFKTKYCILF